MVGGWTQGPCPPATCQLPPTPIIGCGGARGNNQVAWRTEVTLTQPHVEGRAQLLGSLSGNVRKIMGISQRRWSSGTNTPERLANH